jgi:aminoglycoside phosphotransferase (APT) family kinase protein
LLRAHHALQAARLDSASREGGVSGQLVRITNALNEVWRYGPYILRINPQPGVTRLQREARLLRHLPDDVRAPQPVAAGAASWGEWMIAGCVPGQELSRAWGMLSRPERRRSIAELAGCLEALHGVSAPTARAPGGEEDCPHPLPASRLEALVAEACRLPGVDTGVLDAAMDRLRIGADALDDEPTTLVHGDLHLENVLTEERGSVTGVLDFEWCRAGAPDLDLDILLHSLADPALHVESGEGGTLQRRDFDEVVGWLRAAYPALFAHPRLPERLWIYRLAYEVRSLLAEPPRPDARGSSLPPHHPYQRIVRLVEGRSDLSWFVGT